MKVRLLKCLIDQLIALEFSGDNFIDPNFAIQIMESTGAELILFNKTELEELRHLLNDLSKSYDNHDHREYIVSIPELFGFE